MRAVTVRVGRVVRPAERDDLDDPPSEVGVVLLEAGVGHGDHLSGAGERQAAARGVAT